ncbi:hypothetical protein [Kordia sp.]|uniref:hypothetical protein n=1 Tax=Kordia sp. TaxID=1965332 RepID=UPI003D6C2CF0
MKISSFEAFKQAGNVIPQHVLHTISGGTETSSSTSTEEPADPIPPATTHTDPPPPPPPKETTIYRIDGDFVYT